MPGNKSISLAKRAGIVTLRSTGMAWDDISRVLEVDPTSARSIVKRSEKRAAEDQNLDPQSLPDLYSVLNDQPRSGRPVKIAKGSEESQILRNLALQDPDHWQKPWPEIAKEAGIKCARSTVEKVMHEHHDLGRYKRRKKPKLSELNRSDRLKLAYWALQIPQHLFIHSDESFLEINAPRRESNITRPRGANPYDYIIPQQSRVAVTLMIWACIAVGFKGPLYIWDSDTPAEKRRLDQILAFENSSKLARQKERQTNARIPGTEEYRILQELNTQIRQNAAATGQRKMPRRPEWEFKEEIFTRQSNGGIDWLLYREKILRPLLYPWIEQIQLTTGNRYWLIEDNAPGHQKAQREGYQERVDKGIQTVKNWPGNSPDINKIEPLWNYLKDSMAEYSFYGASTETIMQIKSALQVKWEEIPQALIDRYCLDFHPTLELVIRHNGGNNFNK